MARDLRNAPLAQDVQLSAPQADRRALTGFKRGLRGRCPNCGEGRLFTKYLKVRPTCEICGHKNGQYPADDAPPYFTILVVGHLVVAPLLAFPFIWQWPAWLVVAILIPGITILSLVLLPIIKGGVVGVLWATAKPAKLPGDQS